VPACDNIERTLNHLRKRLAPVERLVRADQLCILGLGRRHDLAERRQDLPGRHAWRSSSMMVPTLATARPK